MHSQNLLTRKRDAEDGFTLIELMVVVLIIAILITIAIPSFLGARRRAEDRAAQSNLRTSLVQAKVIYTDRQDYTMATSVALQALEGAIVFVDAATPSTDAKQVSVDPAAVDFVALAAKSKSGTCFFLADDQGAGGTRYYSDPSPANCSASAAPAQGSVAWSNGW
jgi:type IV pilus assembly protein PilA